MQQKIVLKLVEAGQAVISVKATVLYKYFILNKVCPPTRLPSSLFF